MRAAAAQMVVETGDDFSPGGVRIFLQQGRRRHEHAVDAVTALRGLMFDEGRDQRMRRRSRARL